MPRKIPELARRLLLAGAIAGVTLALGSPAVAQHYPWCSNFADGAGTNCGWSTLEQCMITVRGSGGYCSQNDAPSVSNAPAQPRAGKRHARKAS
jgi:hypothetical protein